VWVICPHSASRSRSVFFFRSPCARLASCPGSVPGNEGFQNRPAALAQDVGGDRRQLDVASHTPAAGRMLPPMSAAGRTSSPAGESMTPGGMGSSTVPAVRSARREKANPECVRVGATGTGPSLQGKLSCPVGTSSNPAKEIEGIRLPRDEACNQWIQPGNFAAGNRGKEVESD
jgi:hypothetical protein